MPGPKDSTRPAGLSRASLYDTGIAATQGIPGLLHGGQNPVGPPFAATSMDVDARAAAAAADPAEALTATSRWTNLNTFSNHGGKLIFFHGVSDPWFSALDTIDYYERMTAANGGASKVMDWSRLFLVPGMGALRRRAGGARRVRSARPRSWTGWRRGRRRTPCRATGRALPGRSRPLCALSAARALQGHGRPAGRAQLRVPELTVRSLARTIPSGVGEARIEMTFCSPSFTFSFVATDCSRTRTSGFVHARNGRLGSATA